MASGVSNPSPAIGDDRTIDPAVLDQAAAWFVRMASGLADTKDQQALSQWRPSDPEHERAWQKLQGMEQRLRGSAARVQGPMARATLGGVAGVSRRRALKTLAWVAATGGSALWARQQPFWQQWTADYRSGVGERRSLMLADGTQLLLNTATAVDVYFDAEQRRLILRGGELRVVTAADSAGRSFIVTTPEGTLRPIGTRFTVRRLDGDRQTCLTVSEGKVEVRPRDAVAQTLLVQAGQQTAFSGTQIAAPMPLDEAATAWTDGILTAERMRLSDFLAELGRYRLGRLSCDPAVADLRLTGAYPLNDTDRILAALQQTLPVRVNRYTRYWVTVSAP